jgi:propionate CoA-transferase
LIVREEEAQMLKVMTASEAIKTYIKDGSTVGFGGFIGAVHPEEVTATIEQEFLATGSPRNLTIIYAAGMGDGKDRGLNHLGVDGLVSKVIGGHWGLAPKLQKLALENKLAAYNLPQGVISQLFRDIAAGRPGVITHVGLKTYVDPRLEGGKFNEKAKSTGDVVELIQIDRKERLFYKALPIDVAIIRATYADTRGNCTMEHEGITVDGLSLAQAAKNSGGKVIVQVQQVVEFGTLDSRLVKIPGIYVDAVVVAKPENHMQTFGTYYNPAYSGEIRVPLDTMPPLPLGDRKIIARRAAMELTPNAIVNLGLGIPESVASVATEEGLDDMVLTTESGTIGGVPAIGSDFGVNYNAECVLDQPYQFDFYDGGGLDVAFLGLAEMDAKGNINVSKFGPRLPGCGGFINITQNAKKIVYCGTFTAGGLKIAAQDGKLAILQEGANKKLVEKVQQITFSGEYAQEKGQIVLYITERAVFQLTGKGVVLKEVAPGVDLERNVLALMDFSPIVEDVKLMDGRIFREEKMGLHF